jgi:hypothetical protein
MPAKPKSRAQAGSPTRGPAAKVRLGGSEINPSDLKGLQTAWQDKRLVIFLGAGVSLPYGLPSWRNLVLDLLFEQVAHTRALGTLWPHYRRALAEWMMDYFDYNPLVLGRMIERDIRKHPERNRNRSFMEQLQARLYADLKTVPPEGTALQAVARLIKRSTPHAGAEAAVTFNYDDLLEQELLRLKVPHSPVIGPGRQQGRHFPVIHPHGYVPRSGPAGRDTLVFTEDDYHRLSDTVFHWSLSELVVYLRKFSVLFIGLSMSDPNLRRLLDACRNSRIPQHWQIQKRHSVHPSEMQSARQSVERRARHHGQVLGFPGEKQPGQMEEAIRAALRQADTYDREVFQSMGVKTIWIEDWPDLPLIIDEIGR